MSRAYQQSALSALRSVNRFKQTKSPAPSTSFSSTNPQAKKNVQQPDSDEKPATKKPNSHQKVELPNRDDLPIHELTYNNFVEQLTAANPGRELIRGDVDAALNRWIRSTKAVRNHIGISSEQHLELTMQAERYWEWREKWFGSKPVSRP